jgi:hypothetical protein
MKLKLRASLSYFSAVSYFPLYLGTPEFPFFFFGVAMAVYRKKNERNVGHEERESSVQE